MKKAQVETFGDVEVLILETEERPLMAGSGIQQTAAFDLKAFTPLKKVIASIAEAFSRELEQIAKGALPNEIEITLSLGLSGGGWIIGVEGEGSLSATFKWKGLARAQEPTAS